MKLGTCPYRKFCAAHGGCHTCKRIKAPTCLGLRLSPRTKFAEASDDLVCVCDTRLTIPHRTCLAFNAPRMPRKYSFFLSGRLAVQRDDVWTERINVNKESSSRLERGWGSKALDLKPTSTWRLKVTL